MKLFVTLHGAREDAVQSICGFGAKDLRRTDPGYAGAGIYTTIQAESAMAFGNSGEFVRVEIPAPRGVGSRSQVRCAVLADEQLEGDGPLLLRGGQRVPDLTQNRL